MSRASLFSLAGFQVTFNGRFWVTAEEMAHDYLPAMLRRHVSPIEWDNIILYGQYVFDRGCVRYPRILM